MKNQSRLGAAVLTALSVVGIFAITTPAFAGDTLVSVEGTRQGKLVGESARKDAAGKFVALSISYEVKSPRDVASGQAMGRRQHGPICVTKTVGGASPQLFQALVTNEALKNVLFEFVQTDQATGKDEVFHTIRLSGAVLSSYRLLPSPESAPGTSAKHAAAASQVQEEVCFSFQGIEMHNKAGKTTGADGTVAAAVKRK